MSDNSLERQIQKMMEGLEFKPDPAVWKHVKAGLAPEKKKPLIGGWRIPLLLLLLVGTGAGIWSLSHNNSSNPTANGSTPDLDTYNNQAADSRLIKDSAGHNLQQSGSVVTGRTQTNTIAGNSDTAAYETDRQLQFNDNKSVNPSLDVAATAVNNNGTNLVKKKKETGNGSLNRIQAMKNTADMPAGIALPEKSSVMAANNTQLLLHSSRTNKFKKTAGNNYVTEPDGLKRLPAQYPVDFEIEPILQKSSLAHLPLVKQNSITSLAGNAPVITNKKQSAAGQWHFLPFVNGGIAKITGDNDGGISTYQKSSDQVSYNASPGSAQQAVRAIVYYNTSFNSGKAFSAGFLAEHSLLGKLSVQTGLRYQYVHYSTLISMTTDTIGRLPNGLYSTVSTSDISGSENYRMHYLGIPVLLHYDLTNPVGITTGIINDFMVGANKDGTSLGGAMTTWMPTAYFAFVVKLPGQSKSQWQLMPYMQYGLKTMAKQGNQRLLQPGLQITWKLNN